ncbi:hypothetical protein CVT25_005210 [Psilocybe cyanescens]|uniref:Uncharacterized protein n=1 Tax=Psilocybe cyanescens TaxID=93625 RepID=A0A409XBU4_PSICY|nr:hypothetical protein CVT25_005210 [Psilocybe cyanescens]
MSQVLNGSAPPFHEEWIAFLNSMLVYKACTRIPLPAWVKRFFWKRTDDILSYSSEILIVLVLASALFTGYSGAGVRSKSVKADFWKIVMHPDFMETAEELCPQLFGWYAFFVPIQQRASLEVQRVAYEAKNTKKNFRALFTRSPAEAVKMYQAEQLHRGGGRLPKPPSGCSAFMSLELSGHLLTDFA